MITYQGKELNFKYGLKKQTRVEILIIYFGYILLLSSNMKNFHLIFGKNDNQSMLTLWFSLCSAHNFNLDSFPYYIWQDDWFAIINQSVRF